MARLCLAVFFLPLSLCTCNQTASASLVSFCISRRVRNARCRRRVRERETSTASAPREIGAKRWTPRLLNIGWALSARSTLPTSAAPPLSSSAAPSANRSRFFHRGFAHGVVDRHFVRACRSSFYESSLNFFVRCARACTCSACRHGG